MKNRKNINIFLLISVFLFFVLTLVSCQASTNKNQEEAKNYLSQFARNESIVYADDYRIYTKDETIEFSNRESLLNANILFVTKTNIYYAKFADKKVTVYKTEYDFEASEVVYSYETSNNGMTIGMLYENTITYSINDKRYVYFIQEDKLEDNTDNIKTNEYYSYKKETTTQFMNKKNQFVVTEKKTGQERYITYEKALDALIMVEQAKKLNDLLGIEFYDIYLINENIYVQCKSENIVTTYSYDFQNEKFAFVDWVQIPDSETYKTFFLE